MKLNHTMCTSLLRIGATIVGLSILIDACDTGGGDPSAPNRYYRIAPPTAVAQVGGTAQFWLEEVTASGEFLVRVPSDQATIALPTNSVATIDKSGLATCIGAGIATIGGGPLAGSQLANVATLTCEKAGAPPTIVVTPKAIFLRPGVTASITATVGNATGAVSWSSRNPAVATIGSGATATLNAIGAGDAFVVASLTVGATTISDSTHVVVENYRISPATASVAAGASQQFSLQGLNASGALNGTTPPASLVTWTSSAPTIAAVDAQGNATCASTGAGGTTTIGATYQLTLQVLSATLTCAAAAAPTIAVTPKSVTVQVGQTASVTASVANATGPISVTWSASDANVQVTASGTTATVKGLNVTGATPYNLVASYTQGGVTVKDVALITVTAAATAGKVVGIAIEPRDAEMTAPSTLQYHAILYDAAGNTVTTETGGEIRYTSSVSAAATIDAAGKASGKSTGTTQVTQITASYFLNGASVVSTTTPLTVYPPTAGHAGSIEISTANDTRRVKVGETVLFRVIVRDSNGNEIVGGEVPVVTWSNHAALTIARDGSPGGFFFTMHGDAAAALPGVAVKADITGAAATINIVVVP